MLSFTEQQDLKGLDIKTKLRADSILSNSLSEKSKR